MRSVYLVGSLAVIPAKAGIQASSPRRRGSSSFNGSRVFCATQYGLVSPAATHTCGWLTHGRLLFFACAKKSNQKKHTPKRATSSFVPGVRRSAAHPFGGMEVHRTSMTAPPHPRPTGRSPTRRPHKTRLDSNRGSLEYSRWGCGTRRALRGVERPTSDRNVEVFSGTFAGPAQCWRVQ